MIALPEGGLGGGGVSQNLPKTSPCYLNNNNNKKKKKKKNVKRKIQNITYI